MVNAAVVGGTTTPATVSRHKQKCIAAVSLSIPSDHQQRSRSANVMAAVASIPTLATIDSTSPAAGKMIKNGAVLPNL
jgi:hypothetical protein